MPFENVFKCQRQHSYTCVIFLSEMAYQGHLGAKKSELHLGVRSLVSFITPLSGTLF